MCTLQSLVCLSFCLTRDIFWCTKEGGYKNKSQENKKTRKMKRKRKKERKKGQKKRNKEIAMDLHAPIRNAQIKNRSGLRQPALNCQILSTFFQSGCLFLHTSLKRLLASQRVKQQNGQPQQQHQQQSLSNSQAHNALCSRAALFPLPADRGQPRLGRLYCFSINDKMSSLSCCTESQGLRRRTNQEETVGAETLQPDGEDRSEQGEYLSFSLVVCLPHLPKVVLLKKVRDSGRMLVLHSSGS